MKPGLINRIEKVIAAAEAELERADAPLALSAIVVGGNDEEAAKARVLAEHLKLHPENSGRSIGWTIFRIELVEAPGDSEIHYTTVDSVLTLTTDGGEPIRIGDRGFSRRLLPGEDEAAVAEQLAREAFR